MTTEGVDLEELAFRVAADGLGPAARLSEPLDETTWEEWRRLAGRWQLDGFLARAVAAGRWGVSGKQRDAVLAAELEAMARVVVLERTLLAVAGELRRADIPFRVLKGSAYAHLDYPDPSTRPFRDVDLLVPGVHLDQIDGILAGMGGQRQIPSYRPGFDQRFSKGFATRLPDGVEVDVHRTLVLGPFGLAIPTDDLWVEADHLLLGGQSLATLPRPLRCLHAAYHAVIKARLQSPLSLRDVAECAPTDPAEVDSMIATARRWQGSLVLATAVSEAEQLLEWTAPSHLSAWAAQYSAGAREQRWLASSRGTAESSAARTFAAMEAIPRWTDRLAYVRAAAFPRELSLMDQARRLRRGLVQVAAWLRGSRRGPT